MSRLVAFAVLLPLLAISAATVASPRLKLDDVHLAAVGRTADEAARIAAVLRPTTDFSVPERFEENQAGAATVPAMTYADAFSQPSANMSFARELDFRVGNGLFRKLWVAAPSSTLASDGLGPLYNARGCQNCHFKDGRGHPPEGPDDDAVSMFLRVSIPGAARTRRSTEIEGYIATLPDPTYGGQLQEFGTAGHPAEYRLGVSYEEREVPLAGGETASLRATDLSAPKISATARCTRGDAVAPGRAADDRPRPARGGAGGGYPRPRRSGGCRRRRHLGPAECRLVAASTARPMLGRFGWKAGAPTILRTVGRRLLRRHRHLEPAVPAAAGATARRPRSPAGPRRAAPTTTAGVEIDAEGLDLVAFYSRNLGVPARRDVGRPAGAARQGGVLRGRLPRLPRAQVRDPPARGPPRAELPADLALH